MIAIAFGAEDFYPWAAVFSAMLAGGVAAIFYQRREEERAKAFLDEE
jgi:hypothetical protein